MIAFPAQEYPYSVVETNGNGHSVYPLIRNANGKSLIYNVSPLHGRSFVVDKSNERYVISKGNGLGYTNFSFIHTGELNSLGDDTWGLLLRKDAIRDYRVCNEVAQLNIKTNIMDCVIEIPIDIRLPNGHILHPTLLQYTVECPYRISDAAFMSRDEILSQIEKWDSLNEYGYNKCHLVAANVMIRNLRVLHDHNILHNAIHEQNYTWALELLDFELARTPNVPYEKDDYERHVPYLYSREILQTYVIINHIAQILKEKPSMKEIDNIFMEYGFNLRNYQVF